MSLVDAINLLVEINTGNRPGWSRAELLEVSAGVYGVRGQFYDAPGVIIETPGEMLQLERGYGISCLARL